MHIDSVGGCDLDRIGSPAGVLNDLVGGCAQDVGVVTEAARERVVTGAAVEEIVPTIARDRVVQRVAGRVDVRGAGQRELLDVGDGRQRVGDGGHDRIHAALDDAGRCGIVRGRLTDDVAAIIDVVRVVAGAAGHRVRAGLAVEHVGAVIAGQRVRERVARRVDVGRTRRKCQVLDVHGQCVGHGRDDGIGARARRLLRDIERVVYIVGIVAGTTDHGVIAGLAVQDIGEAIAREHVGRAIARCIERRAGNRQVLEVAPKCKGDRGLHGIGAAEKRLVDHDIPGIVDDEQIVTGAAAHGVGPSAAVERIVAGARAQGVIAGYPGKAVVAGTRGQGITAGRARDRFSRDVCEADRELLVERQAGLRDAHRHGVDALLLVIEKQAVRHDEVRAGHIEAASRSVDHRPGVGRRIGVDGAQDTDDRTVR